MAFTWSWVNSTKYLYWGSEKSTYMNYCDEHAYITISPNDDSWSKLSDSSFQTFLKLIKLYKITSDRCLIVFARKMVRFCAKHHSNSTKCLVNKLKVPAFTSSFSSRDVIESCLEILASILNRPAKFKLIKLRWHMSLKAHRESTRYGDICHRKHTERAQGMVTYVTDTTQG